MLHVVMMLILCPNSVSSQCSETVFNKLIKYINFKMLNDLYVPLP